MAWVLAAANRLILHFRDFRGKHSTMDFWVAQTETNPAGGAAAEISTAAQNCSAAALYVTELLIAAEQDTSPTYGTSKYDRPSDKAAFGFSCADGTINHMQVGAPLESLFSNGWDIDMTAGLGAALLTQMKAHAVNQEGAAILDATPAHRRRPPRRKQQ